MMSKTLRQLRVRTSRVLALGACCWASVAPAQTPQDVGCIGRVSQVGVSVNGTVVVQVPELGLMYLCNVEVPVSTGVGTFAPEVCRSWLSMFITAKSTGQEVQFTFTPPPPDQPPPANWCQTRAFAGIPNPFPYFAWLKP
jgi:hypothetical protein